MSDAEITELERLSDDVRKGHPIGLLDAVAVAHYQIERQKQRKESRWWNRLRRVFRSNSHE